MSAIDAVSLAVPHERDTTDEGDTMTNETAYITTHDHISPDADLFADVDALRAYLVERHEEDPQAGWDRIIDTLTVRERTVYADVGDGLGLVEVAHQVRTTTVDGALAE